MSTIVRNTDPATSQQTAKAIEPGLPAARLKALRAVFNYGDAGATYHDVIEAASYTRLTELNRAGLIECIGTRAVKGRQARVWRVTQDGEDALLGS